MSLCEQGAYTLGTSLCHSVGLTVSFVCTIYPFFSLGGVFPVYPWKAITGASFSCKDKYINALLKSASKPTPQFLNNCGSKVSEELRLEVCLSWSQSAFL